LLSGTTISTFVDTVWATDTGTAYDVVPLTTTVTRPLSTITIKVVQVFTPTPTYIAASLTASAAALGSTPASTFVFATSARPEHCMVPGGGGTYPLMCADTPVAKPAPTPTLTNGTVVLAIQKSPAIPITATNPLKLIVACLKSVFSFAMGSGKKSAAKSRSLCLAANGDYFVFMPVSSQPKIS